MTLARLLFVGPMVALLATHAANSWGHGNPRSSAAAGGGGGQAFSLHCNHDPGKVLIGIKGRSGTYVDRIVGICAAVDQVLMMTDLETTASRGGTGGTRDFEFRCPTGQAMVGLHGKAGGLIDSIGISCARITRDGLVESGANRPVGSSGSAISETSGGGGGQSFSLSCPASLPARSLIGRAGWYLDRIQLGCHPARVAPISASRLAGLDMAVAIRNMPWVVRRDTRITVDVELWSVGSTALPLGGDTVLQDLRSYVAVDFPDGVAVPTFSIDFLRDGICNVNLTPVRCYPRRAYNPGDFLRVEVSWNSGNRVRNSIEAAARLEGAMAARTVERNTSNNVITVSTR